MKYEMRKNRASFVEEERKDCLPIMDIYYYMLSKRREMRDRKSIGGSGKTKCINDRHYIVYENINSTRLECSSVTKA